MTRWIPLTTCFAVLALGVSIASGQGASPRQGSVIIPDSNVQQPGDIGVRSHTNYLIFVPAKKPGPDSPQGETPGSIACIYGLVADTPGCPIETATAVPSGGSGIIAIVSAFDYPTAQNDFDVFSAEFGLPHGGTACNGGPCFTKVSATGGSFPRSNASWALESALDIEWAHAMAPSAQIVLVEAASNRFGDLLDAVDVASEIVSTCNHTCDEGTGAGEVSMSWGGSEFSQEDTFDGHFATAGIVYTAASGDDGGMPIWPCTSPNVVCAGGTTVLRAGDGTFDGETAWSDSGGGPSVFEPTPDYQSNVASVATLVGDFRGTPDLSLDSDPGSGVSIYDTTPYHGSSGWFVIGGTSVAAQGLAGIINLVGTATTSTQDELTAIYDTYDSASYSTDFTDITSGSTSACSLNIHRPQAAFCLDADTGWDFITGVGTNLGTSGK